MAYVNPDYKSKKEFKEAVAKGARPQVYNPSGLFVPSQDGTETIEGPHFPKPHKWYARVQVEKGVVIKVLS